VGLWLILEPERGARPARRAAAAVLLAALSWTLLAWTASTRAFPDAFPDALPTATALLLAVAGILLGTGAFAAAGGRADARSGVVFGLFAGALGAFASRWPQLARGIALAGAPFGGASLSWGLPLALGLTAAALAAALTREELRPHARSLAVGAALLWIVPTLGTEAALARWWGFGPRSLAEAAGVPTNADAGTVEILRLAPSRWRTTPRESLRMAEDGVDASPQSLSRLETFLRRTRYRGVFAAEALGVVRRGWRRWWFAERALDMAMLAVPGRVHPDYREALDLLKAGPLTDVRYDKLRALDRRATESPDGLERVSDAQRAFEGFIAAYARFGDAPNGDRWLRRADSLRWVSDRPLDVATLEGFRGGSVSGSVTESGIPPKDVMVGLFLVWASSGEPPEPMLSDSVFPDSRGDFRFSSLGPGDYELALMGPADALSGRLFGSPGVFHLDAAHPSLALTPIRLVRGGEPWPAAVPPNPPPLPPGATEAGPPVRWPGR
jgi:hypothetical protein